MATSRFHLSPQLAAILVVGIAVFADTLIYFLLVPLLPSYAARFALGPLGVGLLVWSYSAALLGSTLPLGPILERRGRRGPMLWGLVLLAATTLLFAFGNSYPLLVSARVLQGVAGTITWVTGMALLADVTPPEQRGRAMGTVFAFANFGLVAGPPLSGWLCDTLGPRSPYVVAAGLVLLDAVARALLLKDPPRRPGLQLGIRDMLKDPVIRILAGAMALGAALTTVLETVLPVHFGQSLGFRPSLIGLLFGFLAGGHMATSPLMGALSDRVGRRRVMTAGFLLAALLVPLAAWLRTPLATGLLMASLGINVSLCVSPVPPAMAAAVDARGSSSYAVVFAILNSAYGVGMLLGPMAGTAIQAAFGLPVALGVLGLGFLAFTPLLRRIRT